MAIIRSGVLGNTRGKVAGVVGSQWKDKNYLREYVKPANPNTAAQQTQRTKMADCVAFAKSLVGPVFNAYTDKFQKSMSGFNHFIKQNILKFDGSVDYSTIVLTDGKLHAPDSLVAVYNTANGNLAMGYGDDLGNNGANDDGIYFAAYDKVSGLWYFASAEADRSDGTMDKTIVAGLTATNLECYLFAIQYSGTIVSKISDSLHATASAA